MSQVLGLSWSNWARIAVASWVLLFAAAWASLCVGWMGHSDAATILVAGAFIMVVLAHAVSWGRGQPLAVVEFRAALNERRP